MNSILESREVTEEKFRPAYKSQEGFVQQRPMRGVWEIEPLFNFVSAFNGTICGGYVRWMCSQADNVVTPSDVDVYFTDEQDYKQCRRELERRNMFIVHENNVSVSFFSKTADMFFRGIPDIQLIKPIEEGKMVTVGDMDKILSNFDFTCVRAGLIIPSLALVDADFEHDETRKILRLKNIHCPVGSTMRCMKYSKKGYWLPPTQALKLFFDWDLRSDEYKEKLIEYVTTANEGEGLTQKQIDEMEAMMRVD